MRSFEHPEERYLAIIPDDITPRAPGEPRQLAVREVIGEVRDRNEHTVVLNATSQEIVSISGVRRLPTNAPVAVIIESAIKLPLQ